MSRRMATCLALIAIAVAGWALHRQLAGLDWQQVQRALAGLGWRALLPAGLLLMTCFACYATLEQVASRQTGSGLAAGRAITGSLAAQGVSLSTGKGPLIAGLVRLRVFGRWGWPIPRILTHTVLVSLFGNLGLGVLGLVCAIAHPWGWAWWVSGGVVLALIGWSWWCRIQPPFEVLGHAVAIPPWRIQVAGMLAGGLEKLACATLAWTLIPGAAPLPLMAFIAVLLIALLIARASQVPGGVGVLEATVLGLWPLAPGTELPREQLVAGLLAFRCAYYLVPLVPGVLVLAFPGRARMVEACATASA